MLSTETIEQIDNSSSVCSAEKNSLFLRSIMQYGIAAVFSLTLFVLITHAWKLTFSIPFFYSGDSIAFSAQVKSLIDSGWYLVNQYLGAPGGYNLSDYPVSADNLHFILFKVVTYFTRNYAVILNLFYIATFPGITLSALFVLGRLGLRYPYALAASLLFALLPYHFIRASVGHLFLASYFVIPLATWLCILIANNQIGRSSQRQSVKWVSCFLLCLIIGSSGFYYAIFSIIFMLLAGVITSFQSKQIKPTLQAVLLSCMVLSTVGLNMAQTFEYRFQYGNNTSILDRVPAESELYGLKIAQMLLPLDHDRLQPLAHLKERYNNSAPLVTHENGSATLGIVGAAGFIILLAVLLLGFNVSKEITLISKLNFCAVLLATVGGFCSLFAYTISPLIRCYSRISVFLAFFSLLTIFYVVQKLDDRYFLRNKIVTWMLALFLLGIGCFSQTNSTFTHIQNEDSIANYSNDAGFVKEIEALMPKGSMIYQLPYVPFPENPAVFSMKDYDHFRPYLHSHDLYWSYGALKGRPVANWLEKISHLSTMTMLKHLAYAGYKGIYINRNGYADHGVKIEKEITSLIKTKPIVNDVTGVSFYDMRNYIAHLKKQETSSSWDAHIRAEHSENLSVSWGKGFYELEKDTNAVWHWSNNRSVLNIVNYDNKPLKIRLSFRAVTSDRDFSDLFIKGREVNEKLRVNSAGIIFTKTFLLAAGQHKIAFYSDAQRVFAPADPRQLHFRIENLAVEQIEG
jgi:hypothetical protein